MVRLECVGPVPCEAGVVVAHSDWNGEQLFSVVQIVQASRSSSLLVPATPLRRVAWVATERVVQEQ